LVVQISLMNAEVTQHVAKGMTQPADSRLV